MTSSKRTPLYQVLVSFCFSLELGRLLFTLHYNRPGACRRIPSSARERGNFLPDKDGEAGDVGSIVDTAGCRQAKKGPLEARSNSLTGS